MYQLLQSGIVTSFVKSQIQSPSDLYHQVEKEVLENNFKGGIKGTKQKEEFKLRIVEKLREIRSEGEEWQHKRMKRSLNDILESGGEKRRKLMNGVEHIGSEPIAISSETSRLEVGPSSFSSWP
jgi:hypothetical protein